MNAASLEPLLAAVRARISDPARQAIAAQIADDAAQLSVRALAGEDVSAELAHVRAQGLLLASEESEVVRLSVLSWVAETVGTVLRGALVAAAG